MKGRREDNSVIPFINLVRDHQCIWDYSISAYSKTDVTNTAWMEIASEINDTVKNCRERWKNIRTAYVRSLKQPKSGASLNSKKTYYLAEHLAFLLPYLKGGDTSGNLHVDDTAVEVVCYSDSDTNSAAPGGGQQSSDTAAGGRKRTRPAGDLEREKAWMRRERDDEDVAFFTSLLPHVRRMSPLDKLSFRIEVQKLVVERAYGTSALKSES